MDHHKPEVLLRYVAVRVFDIDPVEDTLPPPTARGLLGCATRFFQ
jgi:hypothetical protein